MLFCDAGLIGISAFISPYRSDRAGPRRAEITPDFHEIQVAADLSTCESRDPKDLCRLARAGKIDHFTGISAPCEAPESPELIVNMATTSIATSGHCIVDYVVRRFPLVHGERHAGVGWATVLNLEDSVASAFNMPVGADLGDRPFR